MFGETEVRADDCGSRSGMDPIKEWLYDRLRDSARPLFVFTDRTIPAASVWTGSRKWVRTFREQGIKSGDRVVMALPQGPEFIQVLVAALWEELSLFLIDPDDPDEGTLDQYDARTGVIEDGQSPPSDRWFTVSGPAGPSLIPDELNPMDCSPSSDVRLWLRTSGSTGPPSIIGLSERNVRSVLSSHSSVLGKSDSMLSYLPWTHCFGLMMDLFMAIDKNLRLVRTSPDQLRGDPFRNQLREHSIDHFNTVPGIVRELASSGFENWSRFREGIVGGAPIDQSVARILRGTSLRLGYGQTEAAPGITLGRPGEFDPGFLGRPVGCVLELDNDGELCFRGENAHRATYHRAEQTIDRHPVPRTVATGDIGERRNGAYYFRGRTDDRIKLPNGRFLDPLHLENKLKNTSSGDERIKILPGTNGFDVCLIVEQGQTHDDTDKNVREQLNGLKQYLNEIHVLEPSDVPVTQKGEVDRAVLRESLVDELPNEGIQV